MRQNKILHCDWLASSRVDSVIKCFWDPQAFNQPLYQRWIWWHWWWTWRPRLIWVSHLYRSNHRYGWIRCGRCTWRSRRCSHTVCSRGSSASPPHTRRYLHKHSRSAQELRLQHDRNAARLKPPVKHVYHDGAQISNIYQIFNICHGKCIYIAAFIRIGNS